MHGPATRAVCEKKPFEDVVRNVVVVDSSPLTFENFIVYLSMLDAIKNTTYNVVTVLEVTSN